jgi:hypothetical protein
VSNEVAMSGSPVLGVSLAYESIFVLAENKFPGKTP